MERMAMARLMTVTFIIGLCVTVPAVAQVEADAVNLAKVKISEQQKSVDLCPVHLVPSDPKRPSWTHQGVAYRGHAADCQEAFAQDPEGYAKKARLERWSNNFLSNMSTIWCPLMPENMNTGGRKTWEMKGLVWESCCAFCDEETPTEEVIDAAIELLKERALRSFELTGGKYVEGASSPVQGALPWHEQEEEADEASKTG